MWVYGSLEPELDRYRRADEDRCIGKLSSLMPPKIRIPRREQERLKAERTEKARELAKSGASVEEISHIVLMSERSVQDLLR